MDPAILGFVQSAVGENAPTWNEALVRDLASKVAPEAVGGRTSWLLRGDANYLWARWFLEGLADPLPYLDGRQQYPHLYKQVSDALAADAGQLPADERAKLARGLAQILWQEIRGRAIGQRVSADRETRLFLWELFPRCWICGAVFSERARAEFLQEETEAEASKPLFVDFYKPRGVRLTDLRVEIEHVVPHSAGGASELDNLRLSCGWCNRAKSNRMALYDTEGAPRMRRHPKLGIVGVPQPFWVVRFLAVRGRCEDLSGCAARTSSNELTVAPRNLRGAPNPANLIVVCREHDPIRDVRLVAPRYAAG
ncbi:HNH endonuclease signature motif containing protein [Mycobacterium paraense]|uniref:HNH endonuclease signature motif containing protein n=1 Tax=Mycobacterium paraense TaxID=767916 RepID=UPI000A147632|nr:HNH endonuclease signature motif containing protein [Mycobacterium paraense]